MLLYFTRTEALLLAIALTLVLVITVHLVRSFVMFGAE